MISSKDFKYYTNHLYSQDDSGSPHDSEPTLHAILLMKFVHLNLGKIKLLIKSYFSYLYIFVCSSITCIMFLSALFLLRCFSTVLLLTCVGLHLSPQMAITVASVLPHTRMCSHLTTQSQNSNFLYSKISFPTSDFEISKFIIDSLVTGFQLSCSVGKE